MDVESRSSSTERDCSLSELDQLLLKAISNHFDGVYSMLQQAEIRAAGRQEVRDQLLDKFDELARVCSGIEKQLPENPHNISAVLSVVLTLQLFKVTQLSQRRMKTRELLEVLNKALPEPVVDQDNPYPGNAQLKLVMGHLLTLNLDAAIAELRKLSNSDLNKKLISLLQTRVNFIIDIKQLARNQFIPNESFLKQIEIASKLWSNLDEIHDEGEKQLYNAVLGLLAGEMRTLINETRGDFISLLRGYLVYVDPFLEKSAEYETLYVQFKDKLDVKHLMVKMLNDKYNVQEVLATARVSMPLHIWIVMCIYAINMELTDLRFTNKRDSELQALASFFEIASLYKLDFETMLPFTRRFLLLSQGGPLNEEFKMNLQEICKNTLQDITYRVPPEEVRKEQDHISHFLIDNNLSSINMAINEFYFNWINENQRNKQIFADYFFKVLSRDDTSEGFLMGQKHLDKFITQDVYEQMIRNDFDALSRDLEDEGIITHLAFQMQQRKPDGQINLNNKLFSFLESYIKLRQEVQRVKKIYDHATDPHKLQSATFSSLITKLATEYCSSPVFFKMVYSTLLAFRRLFRGSFKDVDDLIKVNNNMRANLRYLQKLGGRPDQELLTSIIHRANILLLEMRANC